MRRFLSPLLCLIVLTAAACGGQPAAPTATLAPTTAAEATVDPSNALAVLAQTVAIPPPGELGYVDTSTTPPAPRQPLAFEHVQLEARDVESNTSAVTDIFSDGRILQDGIPAQLTAEAVEAVRGMLDQIDFYNIEGIYTTTTATSGTRFFLTVEGPRGSRTLAADDSLSPPELLALFNLILSLGQGVGPAVTPAS